jgi:hypothetical protein
VALLGTHASDMSFERMLDLLSAAASSAVVDALRNAELLVATFIPPDVFTNSNGRDSAVIGLTLSALLQTEP